MDMMRGIKERPKVDYDVGSDTLYSFMKEGAEEEFVEVADGVSIELNTRKEIMGIEILHASEILEPLLHNKMIRSSMIVK
ncbi:MAG: hypothetical protein C4B59_07480 [Candidatus Methanogaster sp.]|uniref:Uncharacterized protein n=1 Tax=Candidatus Methanogaster sp. TaxID=3386292 RepID=A0AC61L309_9EURY|nr:MAG: hypothetical protein C4B59_07480 [ANME-2 cluster archaeon]